ncbi:urea transporter [Pseudomonadota bacterium]
MSFGFVKKQAQRFSPLLHSYSEIFFLQSSLAGALLAVITLVNVNVGVAGMVSVAAAYLFARFIGMSRSFLDSGFYTYNALLVGLSIGYLFALTPLSLFFIITAGIFSYLLSVMLEHLFAYYLKLPALSLPFVLISSTAYLASYNYSNLYVVGSYSPLDTSSIMLPYWVEGFFVALGAILFSPNVYAGALFAVVIFSVSRILFLLALMGFYLGATLSGLMDGAMISAYLNINNFNFILIAMALGGVYMVPSPRSYIIAAIAVAIATVLLDAVQLFWANHGIPAFTLPFNLITLTFLYVLKLVNYPLVAHAIRKTPEETLDDYLCNLKRFNASLHRLALPFSGSWTVWQGFNGKWTHQGQWQHAYDFVIEKEGSTHKDQGRYLEEYYAYKKPVHAPCAGRVVKVVSALPDNIPGAVDKQNNWGNLIIIDTQAGWFVELSHFAQDSILVKEGDWVEAGVRLGLCGNSGYSPQPHLHIQVQSSAHIGAATLPFSFQGYLEQACFVANGLPAENAQVEPLFAERSLEYKTTFVLEQQLHYLATDEQGITSEITFKVCMNAASETFLSSNCGKLFFNRDKHSLYFYRLEGNDPWLALFFSALPRLPLLYRTNMRWQDQLPVGAVLSGWRRHLLNLVRAFDHRIGRLEYQAHWHREGIIHGQLSINSDKNSNQKIEVKLHPQLGFELIQLGERRLRLKEAQ